MTARILDGRAVAQRLTDDVRAKVAALFPKHEIEPFTEHFFAQIGNWRRDDAATRERSVI